MNNITIGDLTERSEYFVECFYCGDSSTCDRKGLVAVNNATKEGYTLDDDGLPMCPDCKKENEQ